MNNEFWFGVKSILAFLIVCSLLNYFFPLLYPIDASVIAFGTPFVFFIADLGPVTRCVEGGPLARCSGASAQNFDGLSFGADIVFAYFLGVFAMFVRRKFEEGSSPVFKWSLRLALFLAFVAFVVRLFLRSF